MALHHYKYMTPSPVKASNRSDSKSAFLNIVTNVSQIEKIMKKRTTMLEEKNIKPHPLIFEVDNSREICYILVIGTCQYECDSLIDAVDASLKIYDVLQIPYPPECSKVWLFLKEIFFENTRRDEISDKLTSLIDTFKR